MSGWESQISKVRGTKRPTKHITEISQVQNRTLNQGETQAGNQEHILELNIAISITRRQKFKKAIKYAPKKLAALAKSISSNTEKVCDTLIVWSRDTKLGYLAKMGGSLVIVAGVNAYIGLVVTKFYGGGAAENFLMASEAEVDTAVRGKEDFEDLMLNETKVEVEEAGMTDEFAAQLLPLFVTELESFDVAVPPTLAVGDVKDLLADAQKWAEMGEHEFWTKFRPTFEEKEDVKSAESIGNQMAVVNFNLTMTLQSDFLNPISPVWKSEADEDAFINDLIKKFKDEVRLLSAISEGKGFISDPSPDDDDRVPTAMYDYVSNFKYDGGRLPRATSCTAVLAVLEEIYAEK